MTIEQQDLYITMDETLKAKWLEALRSGEYRQGMGYLQSGNTEEISKSYCCLGVLCDISKKGEWIYGDRGDWEYVTEDANMIQTLDDDFRKELGISAETAELLMTLNDGDTNPYNSISYQYNFSEIADLIENGVFEYDTEDGEGA